MPVLHSTAASSSASVIGPQFVAYVAVDSLDDANKGIEILAKG